MRLRGVDKFNKALREATQKLLPKEAADFHKRIALEALSRIVQRTPVDTGRARGNWQLTIGSIPTGEKQSANPVGEGLAALTNLPPFSVVYITNNVPYIQALEEGHSKQAPRGMVSITLEELRNLIS